MDTKLETLIKIVGDAKAKIALAKMCNDGRKRDKLVREAKSEAQRMITPFNDDIKKVCHLKNNGMEDEFTWGFLESDLDKVFSILCELKETSKKIND